MSRAKAIVLVLTAVAMASQTYSFVTAGMVRGMNGSEVCEMLEEYHDTMRIINVVDTIATLIGPVILIIVMNAMIARNLLLFRRRFQHGSLDECLYSMDTRSEINGTQTQVNICYLFYKTLSTKHIHTLNWIQLRKIRISLILGFSYYRMTTF